MSQPSIAESYHAQTKYTPEGIRQAGRRLDFSKQPSPFKTFAAGTAIDLTCALPTGDQMKDDREVAHWRASLSPADRALAEIGQLLYLTNGVTGMVPQPGEPFLMRAAPSAGGLYPTEVYLVAHGHQALADGIYHYQVRDHSLVRFWDQDVWAALKAAAFDHPGFEQADLALVLTGVFERSAWRYEDRAYRRVLLDTGHVLGNAELVAPLMGRRLAPVGGFRDEAVNELLFLERGEEEALAIALLLPEGVPAAGPAALPGPRSPGREAPVGQRLALVHEAGKIASALPLPEPLPVGEKYLLAPGEAISGPAIDWEGALGPTIMRRRSTRAYTGEAITREQLGGLLDFTYHPAPAAFAPELLQTFLAVHAVDGLEAGCYHYAPARRELRQIRFTALREEVQYLALGQELAGQASVVVFHTADLPAAVARYGDRSYRYLHLDAGLLGQRLNLGAMRLGLGASGIGGFFDDQVNDMLGIPEKEAVLYLTTIGMPAEFG